MVNQSGIEMGQGLHTKVSGGHSEWYRDGTRDSTPRSVVVTQSGIEMGQGLHTKVSGGHSEWDRGSTLRS